MEMDCRRIKMSAETRQEASKVAYLRDGSGLGEIHLETNGAFWSLSLWASLLHKPLLRLGQSLSNVFMNSYIFVIFAKIRYFNC